MISAFEEVPMAIVLHHHPFSRAANTLWALEEVGVPYELRFVDIMKGGQKSPELLAINPMGKLPTLEDGDVVVTEGAAIALYLADRYSAGKLAPTLDDPARGAYLRWSFFAPSVIEPGTMARSGKWEFRPGQAGWGDYEAMLASIESAVKDKEFVLGDRFSMADVVFGGTLRYLLMFKTIDPRPAMTAYVERLAKRPAMQRTNARHAAIMQEHGLKLPGT
jgi:glutathione S-transferase